MPALTDDERSLVFEALRSPRGRYGAERAAQLSGVPERTVYEWSSRRVLVPDYFHAAPRQWSYRDLVYLRLLAWLRGHRMDRELAAARVIDLRARIERGKVEPGVLLTDGRSLIAAGEEEDSFSGEAPFTVESLVASFDLLEPVDDIGRMWGPNLVRPSTHTYISPWVMGGDPVVTDTRIPTSSLYALATERDLSAARIVRLYPSLTEEAVDDAIVLEHRIRETDPAKRLVAV